MTDRRRLSPGTADRDGVRRCLLRQLESAIDAGIDVFQIRERDLEALLLARIVEEAAVLARGAKTRIVVNDRLDVAIACGADGVHLRSDSISPQAARSIAPAGFLIGRSVHSAEEAARWSAVVDYLIAGTIWPSESKAREGYEPMGPAGLAGIVRVSQSPVLAIGGVTEERIAEVVAAGAAGVAAIGLFMGDTDAPCRAVNLEERVRRIRQRFDTNKSPS